MKKKERYWVSQWRRVFHFLATHDLRWGAFFVLLLIVNGGIALFYFLLRARFADSTGTVVLVAALVSVLTSVLWIWRSPLRGWRARLQQASVSGRESDSGVSRIPQSLQGPSDEKRKQARIKRKKRR